MRNDVSTIPSNMCFGCYSCYSSCPQNAIVMKYDSEGFIYPSVSDDNCIQCGLCLTKCPAQNDSRPMSNRGIYRGYAVDASIRSKGSSGGIFCVLSYKTIEKNGIVYGAVYSKEKKTIIHDNSDTCSLDRIFTSKYVQSEIGDSFIKIRELLEEGKFVLFCGTPCQISGLKLFLNYDYSNLLTVDFMCHGVPSAGLFKDEVYFEESNNESEIIDITFRSKINGWRKSTTTTTFDNGLVVYTPNNESVFYRLFLKNFSLRKTCYNCSLYNKHKADITLADDWSVPKKWDDDKGFSLIIINTELGEKWLKEISNELVLFPVDLNSFNFDIYKHSYNTSEREQFFVDYKNMDYPSLVEKWRAKVIVGNIESKGLLERLKLKILRIINIRR